MYLKTQGLVLRVTEYRDSDAMLTVLTKEQGLMSFKARGVRSRRSQLKSACQLLCFSEFTLLERQGYYTVSEAVCLEMFQPMRNDIELLALCSYFAQAAELLSQQDVNDGEVLSLSLIHIYAGPQLLQNRRSLPALFLSMLPAAYSAAMVCAPEGYPPVSPTTSAAAPEPGTPNTGCITPDSARSSGCVRCSEMCIRDR